MSSSRQHASLARTWPSTAARSTRGACFLSALHQRRRVREPAGLFAADERPQAPSAFNVLVMSEESRLGREALETAYALKQLVQAGVRVFFQVNGVTARC